MEELREESSKAIADLTSTLESKREGHGNHLAATADLEDQSRVSQSQLIRTTKFGHRFETGTMTFWS